uniref:Poly(A)-specific ribonuclease PARN n=1 Tax=Caenorhabditis tropicalis TaxID=1561998 RepID=A0A1I7T280_9PELO
MVVITDSNFLEFAPKLRKTLLYADFVAIDFEFLGLDCTAISLHDTAEVRYRILRENVINYRPCQLGLSFFKQTTHRDYKADTYSIPLFQRFGQNSTRISFQSLRFLRNSNFDLNKVFSEGVEHCTRAESQKFEKALKDETSISYVSKDIQIHIELLKIMLQEKCYRADMEAITKSTEEPMQGTELVLAPGKIILLKLMKGLCTLETCIILNELTKAYPQFVFKEDVENSAIKVKSRPESMTEQENLNETKTRCAEAFEGISATMDALSMMRKVIVGHNSLLDTMYLYHYFFARLPEKYQTFKRKFNELFPKVIDTKILAQVLRMELPGVGDSLERLGDYFGTEASNRTVPPELRGYIGPWMNPLDDDSENVYHNAGFDSYITGEVFLKLAHTYINRRNEFKNESVEFKRILQYLEAAIQNRLPFQLMDLGCCNLTGEDSKGCRPDVITIVRRDFLPIDEAEFKHQEKVLGSLMATYQFDMEWSANRKELLLATNTPGSYAFLCEKFSRNKWLAPLDELEAGKQWTFEQRQTAWRSSKDMHLGVVENVKKRWSRRQITRMEALLNQ